jgi:RNA polymerase sigma-70 factor (ECF subfamily)
MGLFMSGDAQNRAEIVAWVCSQILPNEAEVRNWLRKKLRSEAMVDDVIQDAYCRFAALSGVKHIRNARAYFFQTVSHILIDQIRRARTANIESLAEIDTLDVMDDEPSAERIASARKDLARVQLLIADLPHKCQQIFELRRIQGLPQREVAERLGVTENVVEQQSIRGLRLILKALAQAGASDVAPRRLAKWHERKRIFRH